MEVTPVCLIFFNLFIHLWLRWVFASVRGLSLVAASGGRSSSRCAGLSVSRPLLLRSTGSRRAGSAIVAHRPSRSAACVTLPDQGSNPCPLHRQADAQPLRHQGSRSLLNFWPIEGHFQFLAIMNKAAVNICVRFLWNISLYSSGMNVQAWNCWVVWYLQV